MRRGSRQVSAWLLAAFMRVLFFADHSDRQGGKSLLSLCSDPWPVSPGHLAVREKRRGNQCSHCCSRAGCSDSARTRPPWQRYPSCRRAKEALACPPFFSFSLSLLAFITQGPTKMFHRILVCFCWDFLSAVRTMELLCIFFLRLLGFPLGAYPAPDHLSDLHQLSRPDLIFL